MVRTLHTYYLSILTVFLLISPFASEAQVGSPCNPGIQSFVVDLRSAPDATWTSPNNIRRNPGDHCCGASNPDRCLEFKVLFHPQAVGAILDFASGAAPPGHHYYIKEYSQTTCQGPTPLGQPVCMAVSSDTFYFTFCEPGNNPNTYEVASVAGFAQSAPEVTVEGCTGELTVEGVFEESTIQWASTQNSAYDAFLSCTSGCATTIVTVPVGYSGPSILEYEVCADVTSACSGVFAPVCTTATVEVLMAPSIDAGDYYLCPEDAPYTVEVTPTGSGSSYEYTFYDGPDGTGSVICSRSSSPSCDFPTAGTKSVVVIDTDLEDDHGACASTTMNFDIILYPKPPANILGPSMICIDTEYDFSTPNAGAGSSYDWDFGPGASPSSSSSRTPNNIEFSTCGDQTITLTVTSDDGCDSTVVLVIPGDNTPPDLSNCNLPEPVVECGGTAQNEADILAWHNSNVSTLESCAIDDCDIEVTSDYDIGNFVLNPLCSPGTSAGSITVTYTVSDGCQSTMVTVTYTIEDTTHLLSMIRIWMICNSNVWQKFPTRE